MDRSKIQGAGDAVSELPQTPGSVVEATVEHQGKTGRRILLRRPYEPYPWASHQDVCDRAYWADEDLGDVRVIYDPAVLSGYTQTAREGR
jgi:hypothetical protein